MLRVVVFAIVLGGLVFEGTVARTLLVDDVTPKPLGGMAVLSLTYPPGLRALKQ